MAKGNIPLSEIVQAGKDRRPKKLGLVITSHIPLMELQDHKTFPLRECWVAAQSSKMTRRELNIINTMKQYIIKTILYYF